jgi:hypothetical protein
LYRVRVGGGCKFRRQNSSEAARDVEYGYAIAPGARILHSMAAMTSNADFTTMSPRIVADDPGHVRGRSPVSRSAPTPND